MSLRIRDSLLNCSPFVPDGVKQVMILNGLAQVRHVALILDILKKKLDFIDDRDDFTFPGKGEST